MNKHQLIQLLNQALAQEHASQIRNAAADRLKEIAEDKKKQAEALRDRIVYATIEAILKDERRHKKQVERLQE